MAFTEKMGFVMKFCRDPAGREQPWAIVCIPYLPARQHSRTPGAQARALAGILRSPLSFLPITHSTTMFFFLLNLSNSYPILVFPLLFQYSYLSARLLQQPPSWSPHSNSGFLISTAMYFLRCKFEIYNVMVKNLGSRSDCLGPSFCYPSSPMTLDKLPLVMG